MKAIIWDMGGVLLRTEDQELRVAWEEKIGLDRGELHDLVFESEISRAAFIGKATEEDVWKWVQKELALDDREGETLRRDFFAHDLMDQDLVEYIRSLRQDYTVGMITNAWPNIRHLLTDVWQVGDAFEKIIVSAEIGIAKPDLAIYHLACKQLNVSPGDSVFIDDFAVNISAAEEAGMRTILFRNPEQTIRDLQAMLQERPQQTQV